MLNRTCQFASVALAIVFVALPLSACLAQVAEMGLEQRECCEKMAETCNASMMPASHSCCERPASDQAIPFSRIIKTNDSGWTLLVLAEVAAPLPLPLREISTNNFESPPESPPQVSSVLRI